MTTHLSIILPAKNEAKNIATILDTLCERYPQAEILVVNDGSQDSTLQIASNRGAIVINHPYSLGNGAAIKSAVRAAKGEILVMMDADGQHNPDDISRMLEKLEEGFDMVVGARRRGSQASWFRGLANALYNGLASYMTGQRIQDLTSGFRAVRAEKFREFLYLLPNGFSYPTTITMAFFRAGYLVNYLPITAGKRAGKSHIQPWSDGLRFLLIIFKIGSLYSPLKLFFPISLAFFMLGSGYYGYTYTTDGRFTNMSALLFTTSTLVFLIGLVSEQVTQLMYRHNEAYQNR